MRGDHFENFIRKFGEATYRVEVPAEAVERWRGRLPEQLLTYWKEEGWSGYAGGLIWTVNPDEYEDLIEAWLADTPLEKLDMFHVIARSAFGNLYACGEKVGPVVTVGCLLHEVYAQRSELRPKNAADLDFDTRGFFAYSTRRGCDLISNDKTALFEPALKKLGPLAVDEMYALEPALTAGGQVALENLARVKLHPHLTILRQMAPARMPYANLDLDKPIKV